MLGVTSCQQGNCARHHYNLMLLWNGEADLLQQPSYQACSAAHHARVSQIETAQLFHVACQIYFTINNIILYSNNAYLATNLNRAVQCIVQYSVDDHSFIIFHTAFASPRFNFCSKHIQHYRQRSSAADSWTMGHKSVSIKATTHVDTRLIEAQRQCPSKWNKMGFNGNISKSLSFSLKLSSSSSILQYKYRHPMS